MLVCLPMQALQWLLPGLLPLRLSLLDTVAQIPVGALRALPSVLSLPCCCVVLCVSGGVCSEA